MRVIAPFPMGCRVGWSVNLLRFGHILAPAGIAGVLPVSGGQESGTHDAHPRHGPRPNTTTRHRRKPASHTGLARADRPPPVYGSPRSTPTMAALGPFSAPGPGLIRLPAAAPSPFLLRPGRLLLAGGRERRLGCSGGTGTGRLLGRLTGGALGIDRRANGSGTAGAAGGSHWRRALDTVDEVAAMGEEEGMHLHIAGLRTEHVLGGAHGAYRAPISSPSSGAAAVGPTAVLEDTDPELPIEEDGEPGRDSRQGRSAWKPGRRG